MHINEECQSVHDQGTKLNLSRSYNFCSYFTNTKVSYFATYVQSIVILECLTIRRKVNIKHTAHS